MIRWYDWVVALVCADFIVGMAISAVLAPNLVQAALGGALVFALFVAWDDWCQFRLRQESKRND